MQDARTVDGENSGQGRRGSGTGMNGDNSGPIVRKEGGRIITDKKNANCDHDVVKKTRRKGDIKNHTVRDAGDQMDRL